MKTVDVFGGRNGFGDRLGIQMIGERELNDEPIDGVVLVEFVHNLDEFGLGDVGRPNDHGALESNAVTAPDFVVNVCLAGTVVSHEYSGEMRRTVSLSGPIGHFYGDFIFDSLG